MNDQDWNSLGAPPRLSVLDVAPVGPGCTAIQAFKWTTDVARAADRLGYHRFWVAEHHAVPDIGSSAPAVLIAHLAARTKRIRLGAGGVMLRNHAPFLIAEQFSLLQALYPGRIDLGIGRGKGAGPLASLAIRKGQEATAQDSFDEQLDELLGFLHASFPEGHCFQHLKLSPSSPPPPMFLLNSSEEGAYSTATRGLPLAFAHYLAPQLTAHALSAYRSVFCPGPYQQKPYAIVAVLAVCADSHEEAERLAITAIGARVRRSLASQQERVLSDSELLSPHYTEEEARHILDNLQSGSMFFGTPMTVRSQIVDLIRSTQADELMICPVEFDGSSRMRTLAAVATG